MAERSRINTGNAQGNIFTCICGLRYDGGGAVHVFPLSDPHDLFQGLTFNPNGNDNTAEEWQFLWDDTSVVRSIMQDGGTEWVNHNSGVLEGNSTTLISIKYIAHYTEEVPVASVCFIDDPYTPDVVLWAAVTDFDGGTYHTVSETDWIEITLIVPAGLIPAVVN